MENEKPVDEANKNILSRQFSTATSESDAINGLVIQENFIPYELLTKIFCFLNPKELVICQLVCKAWNELIKDYVWRKKAELTFGQLFPFNEKISWISYYHLCEKKAFNRNLLLSDNVKVKTFQDNVVAQPERYMNKTIEFDKNESPPPIDVTPFPEDIVVNGKIRCIISPDSHFYAIVERSYCIDLLKEGFTEELLDYIQPIIKLSVWYCCELEKRKAEYSCSIKLMRGKITMRAIYFNRRLEDVNQRGRWLQYTQELKNYGKGLRKIKFCDEGKQQAIIGGVSIKLFMPESQYIDKISF